ncbi:hypothetical protein ACFFX0_26610 [Citricoccus parietis]|uniref:Uncharacterized protein n=1 Tax=Citricoccus parietis TaxID=592307 RepID=A0ABV5G6J1_9MICC
MPRADPLAMPPVWTSTSDWPSTNSVPWNALKSSTVRSPFEPFLIQ